MTSTAYGPVLARAVLLLTVPIALVAGCTSGPAAEPTPSATVATTTAAPTPTPTPTASAGFTAADEAAILDVWKTYLATYESAYSAMDPDPEPWKAVGTEELIALQTKQIKAYKKDGITFDGARSARDVTVTSTGPDAAVVRACLDESAWKGRMGDEPLPPRPNDVYPTAIDAIRVDGAWLLSPTAKQPSGETC